MTKQVIKWYMKVSNWELIIYLLTPFTIGTASAIHLSPISDIWMVAIGIIDAVVFFLRFFAQDKNNNGIVDRFENK